jgi:DNA primase
MDPTEVQRAVAAARGRTPAAGPAPARGDSRDPDANTAQGVERRVVPSLVALPTDPTTRLERDALMAILQYPAEVGRELVSRAVEVVFSDATLGVVRDAVATSLDRLESPEWVAAVTAEVPAPFASLVTQLSVAPIPERAEAIAVYCHGIVSALVDRDLLRRKRELLGTMQRLDAAAEPERFADVQRELVRVEAERRALRPE